MATCKKKVGILDRAGDLRMRIKAWRERYHLKPVFSAIVYLVIPLLAIHFIMVQYPLLAKARFHRIMSWIIPFGIGIVAISMVQERFKKGTGSRLLLDGVFVALVMFWLFGLLGGRTVITTSYGSWDFSVDVTPLVAIILLGTSLNFVHDAMEYILSKERIEDPGPCQALPLRGWVVSDT